MSDLTDRHPAKDYIVLTLRGRDRNEVGAGQLADEALDALAVHDPRKAEIVKLQHFVGLTPEEAAAILGITDRTARRDWVYARTWLYNEMNRLR